MFEWALEKVTLRDECLKIRTENISRAQTEEAKHSMEKIVQDLDSPMPLKETSEVLWTSNPWRICGELKN